MNKSSSAFFLSFAVASGVSRIISFKPGREIRSDLRPMLRCLLETPAHLLEIGISSLEIASSSLEIAFYCLEMTTSSPEIDL